MPQVPTARGIKIRSAADAHLLFYAVISKWDLQSREWQSPDLWRVKILKEAEVRNSADLHYGRLPIIHRRLDATERLEVTAGAVFIWEERSAAATAAAEEASASGITGIISGIERWTDGLKWGPSRVRDDFLFYQEKDPSDRDNGVTPPPSAGTPLYRPPSTKHPERLIKQTYSVHYRPEVVNDAISEEQKLAMADSPRKWHLTAYHSPQTIDSLADVNSVPELQGLTPPEGLFKKARVGKKRDGQQSGAPQTPLSGGSGNYGSMFSPYGSSGSYASPTSPPYDPRPIAPPTHSPYPPSSASHYDPFAPPPIQSPTSSSQRPRRGRPRSDEFPFPGTNGDHHGSAREGFSPYSRPSNAPGPRQHPAFNHGQASLPPLITGSSNGSGPGSATSPGGMYEPGYGSAASHFSASSRDSGYGRSDPGRYVNDPYHARNESPTTYARHDHQNGFPRSGAPHYPRDGPNGYGRNESYGETTSNGHFTPSTSAPSGREGIYHPSHQPSHSHTGSIHHSHTSSMHSHSGSMTQPAQTSGTGFPLNPAHWNNTVAPETEAPAHYPVNGTARNASPTTYQPPGYDYQAPQPAGWQPTYAPQQPTPYHNGPPQSAMAAPNGGSYPAHLAPHPNPNQSPPLTHFQPLGNSYNVGMEQAQPPAQQHMQGATMVGPNSSSSSVGIVASSVGTNDGNTTLNPLTSTSLFQVKAHRDPEDERVLELLSKGGATGAGRGGSVEDGDMGPVAAKVEG